MKKFIVTLIGMLIFATLTFAQVQTLTILGGQGVQGDAHPYTEASLDGGITWQPAYLTGWHPWGFATGTNSWINFDPSPFVGLNSTTDYRITFYVPSDFSDPHMEFIIKADNYATVSINGTFITGFAGESTGAAGDLVLSQALLPGVNEITLELIDWGGWVGINYRIDLTMVSSEPPTILPPSINSDSDGDGVDNDSDLCPDTEQAVIDDQGCSIAQYCPENIVYQNHGKYVSCVAKITKIFVEKGLITEAEKGAIVSAAAKSDVGKK